MMRPLYRYHALVLLAIAMTAVPVLACSVPVFRYALDRWVPDPYQAIIFHKGPLTGEQQAAVKALRDAAADRKLGLNIQVTTFDLDEEKDPGIRAIWDRQDDQSLPRLVLQYPIQSRNFATVWTSPVNDQSITRLVDSPARRELAKRILNGDSAVWVLIESGDKAVDDAKAKLLSGMFPDLEKTLEFRPREEIVKDEFFDASTAVDLKIKFSLLRVSRSDPAEAILVNALMRSEDEEVAMARGPVAFPVFGRGRAYYAYVDGGINEETIRDASQFLVGDCTCQVKNENPGVDLLMAVAWNDQIKGGAIPEKPLPDLIVPLPDEPATTPAPLPGENVVAQATTGSTDPNAETSMSTTAEAPQASISPTAAPAGSPKSVASGISISFLLLIVLGIGAVAVIVASMWAKPARSES